jgi:DNA (cytosine-5)-methyltransferase 1
MSNIYITSDMKKILSAVDLFSGCGGLTQGLKDAGFSIACAVEIDEKARATFQLNHPDVPLAGGDIRSVSAKQIFETTKLKYGDLDLLAGCPPCQGFSSIRRRNKPKAVSDERNDLIADFERLTKELFPKMVMLENVPALANYSRFKAFVRSLRTWGYDVRHEVVDVSDFGVPQRRKRLILSANRQGRAVIAAPTNVRTSVRTALQGLSPAGASGDALHDALCKRSDRVQALIAAIPKDGGSRSSLPESMQLACHARTSGFGDVYGRMKWDAPSPTITGGCGSPSKGRFLHPEENRGITLREASLLQGFPSAYRFDIRHGKDAISLMIGNALPPPFISEHARAMAASLEK